ncbi:MAG TPA: glutaredoxin domain-containing protein [Candidatus Paceibacterota bacterium]|nr:glutaredoxin domain-containing protein [Candidatus Paceibacterota bacterium]
MNHSITIYSTPSCHFCHMAKEYLKSKNIPFEDVNVGFGGDRERQKEMVAKSGQLGVPVIDIDGKIVIGFDRGKIDKLLGLS